MELVLHSFKLADRTSAQAKALTLIFCLLTQLNMLSEPPEEYIMWDFLYVNRDFPDWSTGSCLQSKRIVNNLTLLEHRITLADDSGQAAELSVDTCVGHLSGLLAGFDVGEWIVERCGREVKFVAFLVAFLHTTFLVLPYEYYSLGAFLHMGSWCGLRAPLSLLELN